MQILRQAHPQRKKKQEILLAAMPEPVHGSRVPAEEARRPAIRHCAGCGKVLTYSARGATYCSSECRDRKRKELQPAGINALRFAALKQAKRDGVLKQWMASPSFYELYPELTPEQTKGVRHEENLQV